MLGVFLNAGAVAIAGILGVLFKKKLPDGISESLIKALGLCVLVLGLSSALKTQNVSLVMLSIAIGTLTGELLKLDDKVNGAGKNVGEKLRNLGGGSISEGFIAGTLMFVIGSLAIIGSIEAGVSNDISLLISKSVLDGILALFLAATLGIGVALSSISILIFQGALVLLASGLTSFMTPEFILEISAVGGILVSGIGLNFTGATKLKITNMLPALLIPFIWFLLF
ncbi:MAG: DUF554 domain-containing protein [Clostridiaceae bacterium]